MIINFKLLAVYSLIFGVLASDKVPGALTMIYSSLVSTAALGYFLQYFAGYSNGLFIGIFIGILFSLLWLSHLPVGAYLPPSNNFAAAFALLLLYSIKMTNLYYQISIILLISVPVAYLSAKVEMFFRSVNVTVFDQTRHSIGKSRFYSMDLAVIFGIVSFILWNSIFLAAFYYVFFYPVKIILIEGNKSPVFVVFIEIISFLLVVYGAHKSFILFTYKKIQHILWFSIIVSAGLLFQTYTILIIALVVFALFMYNRRKNFEKS